MLMPADKLTLYLLYTSAAYMTTHLSKNKISENFIMTLVNVLKFSN